MRTKLALAAILGFGCGLLAQSLSSKPAVSRRTASAEEKNSINSYDRLLCPPEAKYREWASKLNIAVPEGIDSCADPAHGKLAKLILLGETMALHFPKTWAPDLQADFLRPIGYLDEMSQRVDFDLNQTTTIAMNVKNGEAILLGGAFLSDTPLESLSTLIHEARHSSPADPGHVLCELGDIPRTSGGCDSVFSVDREAAGAYSYGALYSLAVGLFADGLSRADREFMLSDGLRVVGTRFNRLPPALAQAHDLVAVLDAEHRLFLLSPFSPEPRAVPLDFLREGEKLERIEMNGRADGLLLFTSAQRLLQWRPNSTPAPLYPGALDPESKILDASRIRVPFEDYPYYAFLFANRELQYLGMDTKTGERVLTPFPARTFTGRTFDEKTSFRRFFMALEGASIFLDDAGTFFLGARYGSDAPFSARPDLNPGTPWKHGHGGLLSDTLYATNSAGRLRHAQVELVPLNDDSEVSDDRFRWEDARFQIPGAKKFQEGLYLRAQLDEEGKIHFQSFDGARPFTHEGAKAIDFAFFRGQSVAAEILPEQALATTCDLHDTVREPWLGEELGLDRAGYLSRGGDCKRLSKVPFRSLRLVPAAESLGRYANSSGEPARLQVINEAGQSEILRPYEAR